MDKSSQGRTYEEVSGDFLAMAKNPNADPAKVKELGDLRQTLFMGNTLRGMLLNAYAFGTMGKIALFERGPASSAPRRCWCSASSVSPTCAVCRPRRKSSWAQA